MYMYSVGQMELKRYLFALYISFYLKVWVKEHYIKDSVFIRQYCALQNVTMEGKYLFCQVDMAALLQVLEMSGCFWSGMKTSSYSSNTCMFPCT